MGGLGKLDEVYEQEKSGKGAGRTAPAAGSVASPELKRVLERHKRPVQRHTFDGGVSLQGVAAVVSAKFGYRSLTSKMTDITAGVRAALDGSDLVLSESDLMNLRNKDSEARNDIDAARGAFLQIATLGTVGSNKLELEYLLVDEGTLANEDREVIVAELHKAGATKRLHRDTGGEYTFFKLNEWMQVEIMALFADSLNHTPWFRFPFYEVGMEYLKMLKIECGVVEELFGAQPAYASMAFLTDAIPGVVMAGIFAQLAMLAAPLKMAQPSNYDGFDQETFCEELVLVGVSDAEVKRLGGDQVKRTRVVVDEQGGEVAVVVEVPPWKAAGDVLVKIARAQHNARVVEVSGLGFVQLRISCSEDQRQWVEGAAGRMSGVNFVGSYQFPIAPDRPDVNGRVQLAYKVDAVNVLGFLRWVGQEEAAGVQFEQLYDYWGG
jgi:hypothetical protein